MTLLSVFYKKNTHPKLSICISQIPIIFQRSSVIESIKWTNIRLRQRQAKTIPIKYWWSCTRKKHRSSVVHVTGAPWGQFNISTKFKNWSGLKLVYGRNIFLPKIRNCLKLLKLIWMDAYSCAMNGIYYGIYVFRSSAIHARAPR